MRVADTKEIVQRFVENNLHFGDSTQLLLNLHHFCDCKKYCGLALWEIQLTSKEVVYYHTTWLSQHNVLILKDNILRMNFPMLIPMLLAVLNKTFLSIADFEMVVRRNSQLMDLCTRLNFCNKRVEFCMQKAQCNNGN